MDIIVSKVYDKQRFAYFIYLKYKIPLSWTTQLSNSICEEDKHRFANLSETEIRYLQRPIHEFNYNRPKICKLKIINNMPNERKSCIDISPQPDDEPKQETLELFHVKFIKVIHYDEMLNERQIQALLKDKHVKSINIVKQ